MDQAASELVAALRRALPGGLVYWDPEPREGDWHGAVLTARLGERTLSVQFQRGPGLASGAPGPEALFAELVAELVAQFADHFSQSIYHKERFTRIF
ncbi:hypothetical protein GMST_38210 [Geomonas silvestris]|uniref:Uncharacterized protein n=1 Tax=Geomonas silvestris TaxID=2740184 RepID=A0A6V8MN80_9BACT|nr:hypothetical protein [Geomonas silvestris]GFO61496.1 hypothetical protein GMST_38210 [Geomonas silvestris]